jgi:hypothetical protein
MALPLAAVGIVISIAGNDEGNPVIVLSFIP